MNLLILGAGGHGRLVKEIAEATGKYENIDFLDDNRTDTLGTLNDYEKFIDRNSHAFVAIGNSEMRKEWIQKILGLYDNPTLIHPDAYVSPSAELGNGTVVMPKAVVQANVKIGTGCIISSGAIIDHDTTIGDYCHLNAGAIIPSMSKVPNGTKVNYGCVYRKPEMPADIDLPKEEQTFF